MRAAQHGADQSQLICRLPLGLEGSGGNCDHRDGDEPDRHAEGSGKPSTNVDRSELLVLF